MTDAELKHTRSSAAGAEERSTSVRTRSVRTTDVCPAARLDRVYQRRFWPTVSSELISDWCRTKTHSLICCWWGGTEHTGQNPIGQNHRRVSISTTGPSVSEELLTYSSELISDWCRTHTRSSAAGEEERSTPVRTRSVRTTDVCPSARLDRVHRRSFWPTVRSELISDWCRTNTHRAHLLLVRRNGAHRSEPDRSEPQTCVHQHDWTECIRGASDLQLRVNQWLMQN